MNVFVVDVEAQCRLQAQCLSLIPDVKCAQKLKSSYFWLDLEPQSIDAMFRLRTQFAVAAPALLGLGTVAQCETRDLRGSGDYKIKVKAYVECCFSLSLCPSVSLYLSISLSLSLSLYVSIFIF